MDLQSYNDLLAAKGDDPHRIPDGTKHGDTHGYMAFRNDLEHNRVVWYNNKRKDRYAYLKLHHPLLSICCAPKEHPFSRKERFTVLIVALALAAAMSLAATFIGEAAAGCFDLSGSSDSGGSGAASGTTTGRRLLGDGDASGSSNDDSSECDDNIWYVMAGVSACFGVVKAMLGKMMRYMMICPLCEKESCWSCCRCIWGCIGHCLMFIWALVVFAILAVVVIIATSVKDDNNSFILYFFFNFGVNKCTSWLWKLFWLSCCKFPCQWRLELSKPEHKLDKSLSKKGKYHVTFRDLPNYDASKEEDYQKGGGRVGTALKVVNKGQKFADKLEGNGDGDSDGDDNGNPSDSNYLLNKTKEKTGTGMKHDETIEANDIEMGTAPETKVDKKKKKKDKKKRKKDKYPDA